MTYTAQFRQPTGELNRIGATIRQPLLVEIFPTGKLHPPVWRARVIEPAAYLMTMEFPSQQPRDPNYCKKLVEQCFEQMLSPAWTAHPSEEDTEQAIRARNSERRIATGRDRYGWRSL